MKLASQLPGNYIYDSRFDVHNPFIHHIGLRGAIKTIVYGVSTLVLSGLGCMGWLALTVIIAGRRISELTPMQRYATVEARNSFIIVLFGLVALPEIVRFLILLILDAHPRIAFSILTTFQIISRRAYFTRAQYWVISLTPYLLETIFAIVALLLQPIVLLLPVLFGGGWAIFFAFSNRMPRLLWTLRHPPGYFYSENQCDKVDAYSPRV